MIRVSKSWSSLGRSLGGVGARLVVAWVGAVLVGPGCAGEAPPPGAEWDTDPVAAGEDDVAVRRQAAEAVDGRLVGDVGPAEGVDAPAARLSAWDGGEFLSVENVAALPERFVMLYASITQPDEVLRPGTRTYTLAAHELETPSAVVLGCTGREANRYDEYDAAADEVEVVVEPAPDDDDGRAVARVTLTGRWRASGQVASSSFVLHR